jgi:antitoxin FitA
MFVNFSIRNVPEAIAAKLRERANRNHRSLQGELMVILKNAATEPNAARVDGLRDRLMAIAGDRGIDTSKRLTREQAHDRRVLRKAGV